jgi:hypothetical protein
MMGFGDVHRHRFSLGLLGSVTDRLDVPCDLLVRESLDG